MRLTNTGPTKSPHNHRPTKRQAQPPVTIAQEGEDIIEEEEERIKFSPQKKKTDKRRENFRKKGQKKRREWRR